MIVPVDNHRGQKPLDLGDGRVAASFDWATAAWISVGAPHPREGFVELSGAPPFDEASRGDATATRRHRASLADGGHAFLAVHFDGVPPHLVPELSDPSSPSWEGAGIHVDCHATAGGIRQRWLIDPIATRISIRLGGRLDRPALAEITELDPPRPTGAVTTFTIERDGALIGADQLDAAARLRIEGAAVTWEWQEGGLIGSIGEARQLVLEVALQAAPGQGAVPPPPPVGLDRIASRAIAYVRGCTALAIRHDERTIITDHRLLPLSWTRDAYWQALMLLTVGAEGDAEIVADHLRWLWRRCERPDGRWLRSHHANGRRKDRAFQADQQLYPLVELGDYWRLTGRLPAGVRWDRAVAVAWDAAMAAVDAETALVATSENAADDPASAPYIASSQIVLWYAARRMAELAGRESIGLDPAALVGIAGRVRAAFDDLFVRAAEAWPYGVDDRGTRVRYHDANDLPIALAPWWGFCASTDPGWQATMEFAFSAANPGFVAGRRSGLGSLHTPGPWALGDIQSWIRAKVSGKEHAAEAARLRLSEIAFADGMLPEAYAASRDGRVRAWFAWPGAAYAALTTLEDTGRLATIHV